jgi:hypothetical protein
VWGLSWHLLYIPQKKLRGETGPKIALVATKTKQMYEKILAFIQMGFFVTQT